MKLSDGQDDKAFREEARDWLETNKPRGPRPREGDGQRSFDCAWQRRKYDGGWAGLSWPAAFGGRSLSLARQMIWYEEYAKAACPTGIDICWLGLHHAGPTLIAMGSQAQKREHLERILTGEAVWCQGFSEPNAGSDLAAIRTRGVVDGDCLVVDGQKTWTSFAHCADYQELLVRSDPDSKRHAGLTWIICDMRSEGVSVRPIRSLTGEAHNCEVFYDNVRIPIANIVGELNDGWRVAMATLGFERATAGLGEIAEIGVLVEELIAAASKMAPGEVGELLQYDLAKVRADAQALRALGHQVVSRAECGAIPGSEGSIVRLFQTELEKRVGRLAMELLAQRSLDKATCPAWTHRYFFSFAQTIAGGSSEIQRNIIGERLLGLPR